MSISTSQVSTQIIELFAKYVAPNYTRYPACLVRGQGSEVWDAEGNRYLDLFPGWGCNLLGHAPPRVVAALREQVGELVHVPNTWYIETQGLFAKALVERSFPAQAFFCNSGAEANEAAIKLARAYQAPRYKIITCQNSFHGRTIATLSATGQPKYQQGIGPLLPGFKHIAFDDVEAVRGAIDDETAAVMVEPIQGEGGINIPAPNYLVELRQLTSDRRVLLIVDEVQTGMGRTGKWFAFQHAGIEPDIMTLAKGLAGGVACGAMLAKPQVAAALKPGMHASTFGGNPIACRAGLATIETIDDEDLLERAAEIGERFRQFFSTLASSGSLIRQVRVCGAMIGVDLFAPVAPLVSRCLERRLLVNGTQETVLRMLPALTITDEQMSEALQILIDVFRHTLD
jgi:predicted acetylornithine/succinylornithine family transaminase